MDELPGTQPPAEPCSEVKNPAPHLPALLPPFEPFSSSPGLPRATKRKFDEALDDRKYYPTPVPTSSTAVPMSSPPSRRTRPGLRRTVSTLSERAPLGDVPTLDLPSNGEPVLMGRSSNSSDYQLSANRHISRVHVRASYHHPDSSSPTGKVEVACLGWNGVKVHCGGEVMELAKGEVFVSNKSVSQVMIDVQDTRVMLVWPKNFTRDPLSTGSRSPWTQESPSAKRRLVSAPEFASSPPALLPPPPASPISPTPGLNLSSTFSSTFRVDSADEGPVKVYEDHSSDEDAPHDPTPMQTPDRKAIVEPNLSLSPSTKDQLKQSHLTVASEPEEFSEHDEENDPIVHSFGPFGDDILSRFASFKSQSPDRPRKPLKSTSNSPSRNRSAPAVNQSPIKNHVINQLAFSRIHSLPLSTIHSNLPAELRGAMTKPSDTENPRILSTAELKTILDDIPCVGEISREGKDAAGKLLESEFYYVPEKDGDLIRRDTVTQSLGKTSIRAARKQHKVSQSQLCFYSECSADASTSSNTTGNVPGLKCVSHACAVAKSTSARFSHFLSCFILYFLHLHSVRVGNHGGQVCCILWRLMGSVLALSQRRCECNVAMISRCCMCRLAFIKTVDTYVCHCKCQIIKIEQNI